VENLHRDETREREIKKEEDPNENTHSFLGAFETVGIPCFRFNFHSSLALPAMKATFADTTQTKYC
jgi:hypothetical protein